MPLAASSTEVFTAVWMPFSTLVMKYLQYCAALTQPSVSTHIMFTFWPCWSAFCTAFIAPRPTPPATGKMMSAPSGMNVLRDGLAHGQVGETVVNSPDWVCSFQPSTFTCVWCCWL